MSEGFAQSQQVLELAQLPASDPRRQGFEASLERMEPAERQYWLSVLEETDRLYEQMADVAIPPGLETSLMAIPDKAPRLSGLRGLLQMRLTGPTAAFAAIAAVIIVAVVGYLLWQPLAPLPPVARVLVDQTARDVAEGAVTADAAAPLQVNSSDPAVVGAVLGSHSYSFPVMMLTPRSPLALRGGGSCELNGTPAVFTRWKGDSGDYTLFEFDGKKLGMPVAFLRNTQNPQPHTHVVIWPGHDAACTWALVMNGDAAADVFSSGY